MAKQVDEATLVNTNADPQTALEFFERGWRFYSSQEYIRSEADFLKAIELQPEDIDANYGLGMVYQASGNEQKAVQTFEKVIALLENSPGVDSVRSSMLSRFARGHINRIQTGDWHIRS